MDGNKDYVKIVKVLEIIEVNQGVIKISQDELMDENVLLVLHFDQINRDSEMLRVKEQNFQNGVKVYKEETNIIDLIIIFLVLVDAIIIVKVKEGN